MVRMKDNWYEDRIQGHEDVPFSERNKVLCEKSSDIAVFVMKPSSRVHKHSSDVHTRGSRVQEVGTNVRLCTEVPARVDSVLSGRVPT